MIKYRDVMNNPVVEILCEIPVQNSHNLVPCSGITHLLPCSGRALHWLAQVYLPGGLALEALVRRVALPQALDQTRSGGNLRRRRMAE